jgi:hypothetical protein
MTAYVGYIPPNTTLFAGDYLTSPSGVWYAAIGPSPNSITANNFMLRPGSNPTVSPGVGSLLLPNADNGNANLGGFYLSMQGDGNLVLYTSPTGQMQGSTLPVAASGTNTGVGHYAALADDGTFNMGPGLSPQTASGPVDYTAYLGAPVTSVQLNSLSYDFNAATLRDVSTVGKGAYSFVNTTDLVQQGQGIVNISYTRSDSFSFAVSNTIGVTINSSVSVGVPGIAQTSLSVGITDSTTITKGQTQTTSTQIQFSAGFRPSVPPLSEYLVTVSGQQATYDVPYTWTGVATYTGEEGSFTAPVVGSGVFTGSAEGNFIATVSCVIAVLPQTCSDTGPYSIPLTTPVPEPATATMFAAGLLCAAAVMRLRRRQGR